MKNLLALTNSILVGKYYPRLLVFHLHQHPSNNLAMAFSIGQDDNMMWTKTRLKTFKYWPFGNQVLCSPKRMASAGFYATGGREEPDLACCFVCKKSLNGWEETDNPWEEHKKHCPRCPFVLINKEEKNLTIDNLIDLIVKVESNRMKSVMMKKVEEFQKLANAL